MQSVIKVKAKSFLTLGILSFGEYDFELWKGISYSDPLIKYQKLLNPVFLSEVS